jgi:hypothetical protein
MHRKEVFVGANTSILLYCSTALSGGKIKGKTRGSSE